MIHMQKPPPPGQGFLYGEASNQPAFAGSNIHDNLVQNKVNNHHKYSNHFHANKGQSANTRAGLCWRFCFGGYGKQYTWSRRICQAVVSNVVAYVNFQMNSLELVVISRPFSLPACA